jgi:hypothetical protein
MTENYNNNILCRILKKTADLWSSAANYQIFVILAAAALLAILPLFKTDLNDTTGTVFNIIIFCATAITGFLMFKLKGSRIAAFTFAAALVLRLCLVFVLESSTPYMCDDVRTKNLPWIRLHDSVLFQADEFFYVYNGQTYSNVTVSEFINSPEFMDNAYRTSFLMSRLFRFFGDELIWPRLVGAFLGAFAAAIVTLAVEKLFSKNTAVIISLLCVTAPQTAFHSVRFLKEIWVIFAVSMMVFGFAMIIQNRKFLSTALLTAAAIIILIWVRFEYGLMFIVTVPAAIYFRDKSNPARKTFAVLSVILLSAVIFIYQFNQLTHKAEGLLDKYTITKQEQRGQLEAMDRIYKSRGPLRILNIPLALLNPPPKNLHHIYTEENRLYDIIQLANIYQWWIPLPFLIIGACLIIIHGTELLTILLPYVVAICTSAMLLGGLQPNLLRYRDSLTPIAFVIVGAGIESFITEEKPWKNRVILFVYAVFAALTIYFYLT